MTKKELATDSLSGLLGSFAKNSERNQAPVEAQPKEQPVKEEREDAVVQQPHVPQESPEVAEGESQVVRRRGRPKGSKGPERRLITTRITIEHYNKLERMAELFGEPRQKLFDKAIERYIQSFEEKNSEEDLNTGRKHDFNNFKF